VLQGETSQNGRSGNEFARLWHGRLQTVVNALAVLFAATLCMPITVNWVILTAGLVGWLLLMILRALSAQPVYVRPPLFYPLITMAAVATVSGIANGAGAHEAFASFLTMRPLIAYFWAFDIMRRNERVQALCLSAALTLSSLAGAAGALEQMADFHPFGFHWLQGTGFLSGPMAYAGQMQLFSILSLAFLLTGAHKQLFGQPRWHLWAAITAGNFLGVIFASERSAWLGFLVGTLVVTALVSWRTTAKVAGLGLAALLAVWNVIPVFKTRLLPLLDPMHDVSTRARLVVWQKAVEVFREHPILGVGPLNFPHVVIPEALVPGQPQYLGHAHNNYLHILATTGLVGLSVFMWLLCATLNLSWKQYHSASPEQSAEPLSVSAPVMTVQRAIGLGMLGALVSLAVAGIFEYNFGTGQVRLAQWFFVAFLVPAAYLHRKS
jgi:O-antigen ligase